MLIVGIILIIIATIVLGIGLKMSSNVHKINCEVDNKNQQLEQEYEQLQDKIKILSSKNEDIIIEKNNLLKEKDLITQQIIELTNSLENDKQKRIKIANQEYENYMQKLANDKNIEEKEWEYSKTLLKQSYADLQSKILQNLKNEESKLNKVRSTRAAAQEALVREKEIKENKDFYCLPISVADKNDIQVLERIKKDLNKPRILSMLIWSTYFQKQMTALCNNVLGTKTVCGIYKITNQITNECYIGQSVDIAKRWKDHAKCGLGIDTPVGNKLYKAMQEQGIWNFSWELLEKCSREDLDKKEKTYIELYMSNDFGYNSNKGNGK